MKNSIKIIILFLVAVSLVALAACKKPQVTEPPTPDETTVGDATGGSESETVDKTESGSGTEGSSGTDTNTETECAEHELDEGVIIQEPTCYEEGILQRVCAVCGAVVEEPIEVAPVAYTITLVGIGEFWVPESGVYLVLDSQ